MTRIIVGAKEIPDGVEFRLRENGKITHKKTNMRNYFYIKTSDYEIFKNEFDKFSWVIEVEEKNDIYSKIYLNNNYMRTKIKDLCKTLNIETFESDIPANKRWLINHPEYPMNSKDSRYAFWDLETYDVGDFMFDGRGVIIANNPIISCSVVDDQGNEFYYENEGKKDISEEDIKFLEKLNILDQTIYNNRQELKQLKGELWDIEILKLGSYDKETLIEKKILKESVDDIRSKIGSLQEKRDLININEINEVYGRCEEALLKHEKVLVEKILSKLLEYDVIASYNGARFDDPYLKRRAEEHGISMDQFKMINSLDYLDIYKKNVWESKISYSLDAVSQDELGEQKVKVEKGPSKIFELYLFDSQKLKDYNMMDSLLMKHLDDKLNFLKIQFVQSDLAHCFVSDTMFNSNMCDITMLSEYNKLGMVCKDKPTGATKKMYERQSIGGGWTNCFRPGVHKKVEVFDYKSFYPCTIITYNISPETVLKAYQPGCIKTPDDQHATKSREEYHPHRYYSQERQGVLPKLLYKTISERDKTKYEMGQFKESDPIKYHAMWLHQFALKIMGNAYYGFLSFAGSRFYDFDMADSITTCTRWTLKQTKIAVEEGYEHINSEIMPIGKPLYKNGPIYQGGGLNYLATFSDTDSLGLVNINSKYTIEDLNAFFAEFYDRLLKQWNVKIAEIEHRHPVTKEKTIKKHWIVFEHENTYEIGMWFKKKRYAKLTKNKDGSMKLGITGLDCLNSKTNRYAAKLQKEMLNDILYERFDLDQWIKRLIDIKEEIYSGRLSEQYLTMVKTVKGKPEDYEGYVIDKNTGKPKIKKDGTLQKKAVPAQVDLQKRLLERGQPIFIGSKLPYWVKSDKPKQHVEWIQDYEKGMEYSADYYWKAIASPLIRTLQTYDPNLFKIETSKRFKQDNKWGQLFNMTYSVFSKIAGEDINSDDEE